MGRVSQFHIDKSGHNIVNVNTFKCTDYPDNDSVWLSLWKRYYSKLPLLKPLKVKTTPLLRAAFVSLLLFYIHF